MNLFLSHEILNHLIGVFDKSKTLKPVTPFQTIETLFETSLSETYDLGLIDASHLKKIELEDVRELFPNIPLILCCRDLVGFELAKKQKINVVDEIIYISSIEAIHLEQIIELAISKFELKQQHRELKIKVSHQDSFQREHHSNVARQQQALLKLAQLKFKQDTLEHTFENIGLIVLSTLGIERFSIWLMDSHLEQLKCQCSITSEGYQSSDEEPLLKRVLHSEYFDSLEKGHVLSIDDLNDSHPFRSVYEKNSNNIFSIMEAPLFEDGVIYGMIRFEECSEKRKWSIEESYFADAVSDMVTMAIDQWELHRVEEDHRRRENELMKKLEQSNIDLQEFTSIVSHDLQEPLYKVNAFGELLEELCQKLENEEATFFIQRIRSSTIRMQNLIIDLLSFSRVGDSDKNFEEIDLNSILKRCLSDLEVRIKEKNAIIEHDELPKVFGDSSQLQQLFQNILSNALKFSKPKDIPKIEIRSVYDTKNRLHTLSFIDNGIGISNQNAEKIFGVFQRLYSVEEYEGTGIGLAIVDKIANRHGWKVSAQGKIGKGMTIKIEIPQKG